MRCFSRLVLFVRLCSALLCSAHTFGRCFKDWASKLKGQKRPFDSKEEPGKRGESEKRRPLIECAATQRCVCSFCCSALLFPLGCAGSSNERRKHGRRGERVGRTEERVAAQPELSGGGIADQSLVIGDRLSRLRRVLLLFCFFFPTGTDRLIYFGIELCLLSTRTCFVKQAQQERQARCVQCSSQPLFTLRRLGVESKVQCRNNAEVAIISARKPSVNAMQRQWKSPRSLRCALIAGLRGGGSSPIQ